MVDIVQNIWSVAKKLFSLRKKLSEADRQKRIDIAEYLDTVSSILQEVHDSLKNDIVPHGKCKELDHYAKKMPTVITKDMVEDVQELSDMLLEAHTVEDDLWEYLNSAEDKVRELQKIEEAAGWLRGMATTIRAGGKP